MSAEQINSIDLEPINPLPIHEAFPPQSIQKKTRKDTQKFLVSSIVSSIADVIRTIITANILGPYLTGLCTTLLAIPQIAQYFNLGLIEALTVVVPRYSVKGENRKVSSIKNTVLCLTFLISSLCFLLILFYEVKFRNDPFEMTVFVILSAFLIILWECKQFFVTHYAVEHDFTTLSWVEFFFSILTCVTQIIGVYYLHGYGFWLGFIIANLLTIFYSGRAYFRQHKLNVSKINLQEAISIMPLGMTMLISSVTYAPFLITARIFIALKAGIVEAGFFVLSTMIIGKISIIPIAIGKVLVPHLSKLHAMKEDFEEVYKIFIKSQISIFFGTSLFILASYFLIAPAISLILPNYVSGIPAARIMLLAGIPYCLIDNANNILFTLQRKRAYVTNLTIALLIEGVLFCWIFWMEKVTALNISISLLFVFIFYAFLVNLQVYRLRKERVV